MLREFSTFELDGFKGGLLSLMEEAAFSLQKREVAH
jgi:hypothetical protein